jgi:hypothetical protein
MSKKLFEIKVEKPKPRKPMPPPSRPLSSKGYKRRKKHQKKVEEQHED